MNVRLAFLSGSLCALLAIQTASAQQRNAPPPPAPGDEPAAAEGRSPSDQQPALSGRTNRGYAPGQAPGKHVQGPVQGPMQAPEKQAPAPAQAPSKGASYNSGQPYVAGYAPACANCQVRTAAPTVATTTYPANTNYQSTANYRRGILRRGYR